MTDFALNRRAAENRVDVTGFAACPQMRAGQTEAGLDVIELNLPGAAVCARRAASSEQHQPHHDKANDDD